MSCSNSSTEGIFYNSVYVYVFVYVCMCICMWVCVRGGGWAGSDAGYGDSGGSLCVCVNVCVWYFYDEATRYSNISVYPIKKWGLFFFFFNFCWAYLEVILFYMKN